MEVRNAELVARAQQGDAAAFGELYQLYYKEMYAYARYMVGNDTLAEDAVADAVLAAFRQIGSLKKADAFKAWLFRILCASCKRHYTQLRGMVQFAQTDDPETALQLAAPEEDLTLSVALRSALDALEPEEREIILLHVLGGYKSHEIAAMLGSLATTVRSKQHRAMQKLRRALSDQEPGKEG